MPVPDGTGRIVYPASFYASFRPQTATDMLARTPGFTLYSVDEEAQRGFGTNAGNVLIDGQRPTVKTGGIEAVLGRIGAARVERIELIRGALTAEAQGQTLVANVVLKPGAGGSGNASLELRRAPGDEITPRIDLSYARKIGDWQASAGIVAFYENDPIGGRYDLFDEKGVLREASAEDFDFGTRGATLTAAASRPLGGGTLSLNGQLGYEREAYRQRLTPLFGPAEPSRIDGLDTDWNGEIGGDWTRRVGKGWTVKLVGLGRVARSSFSEDAWFAEVGSAFDQRNQTTEAVARATLAQEGSRAIRPEIGGEVAYNRLISRLDLAENGVPVAIAGADTRVSELRGEAFVNIAIHLTRPLRVETGLALEASRITVSGDRATARTLRFWKPSAAFVWDVDTKTQFRIGVRRSARQLDFEAFAAAGNLVDDRPIAGNAELRPEITTAWSANVDHRFGEGSALSIKIARETITNALTYVPLASGGEALTNFGDVSLWRLSGEATLPIDGIVKGARFTFTGKTTRARRPDPVTGVRRDDYRDYREAEVTFRHDVTRLGSAYGFKVAANSFERSWFVSELQKERTRTYVSAYIETGFIPGMKTTLTVSGIGGEREDRIRRLFAPDRAGSLIATEIRSRGRGAYINLLMARQL